MAELLRLWIMRLLLMSNGYSPDGGGYLEHAVELLAEVLADVRQIVFLPYGLRDWDGHTAVVRDALAPLGVEVIGAHRSYSPPSTVESAEAVFIGGGNAFRLLATMYRLDILKPIIAKVRQGMPYIGTSAGTNVACPTIRTTNDMPIAEPPSLSALSLIPFQINPHYPAREVFDGHLGETRDRRLSEFLEDNDVPVLAMQEGAWLEINEARAALGGVRGAKIFRRGKTATAVLPGADLSPLLATTGHFDQC
jgi:dipeptidase E